MATPPAYTDEDVPLSVVQGLRERDFTIVTSLEQGALGSSDDAQLERTTALGCVLLSHNRRHFLRVHAEFRRQGRPHGGITLIPQDTVVERLVLRAAIALTWIGTAADHRSTLYRWNDCQQLLIHGYRPVGFTEDEVRLTIGWE
ncbi:MAG: DUF5615 family PIN-like protein [Chloroflexota bacterium]